MGNPDFVFMKLKMSFRIGWLFDSLKCDIKYCVQWGALELRVGYIYNGCIYISRINSIRIMNALVLQLALTLL